MITLRPLGRIALQSFLDSVGRYLVIARSKMWPGTTLCCVVRQQYMAQHHLASRKNRCSGTCREGTRIRRVLGASWAMCCRWPPLHVTQLVSLRSSQSSVT